MIDMPAAMKEAVSDLPTFAWTATGMRETTEAPMLWVRAHEAAREIAERDLELARLRGRVEALRRDNRVLRSV